MPGYVVVVRRLLRQEASYHVIAESQEHARKQYERGEYLRVDWRGESLAVNWSRPEILDEHIARIFEPSTSPKPRNTSGERNA